VFSNEKSSYFGLAEFRDKEWFKLLIVSILRLIILEISRNTKISKQRKRG